MSSSPSLLGKRILAGFIDYTFVYAFTFAFIFALGEPNEEGGFSVTGLLAMVPTLFWFVYIVLLETFYGATVGNSLMDLKPRSLTSSSGTLSLGQSIKRHLLDPIDMFPFGFLGIILIKNTEKNQRLGDIWAKTIVVSTKKSNM